MYCISMKKSGSELRKAIMTAKKDTTGDSLRGIEYQLLNALSVKNTEKFMDIVARLYRFLWIGKTPDTEWDDSDVYRTRKNFRSMDTHLF